MGEEAITSADENGAVTETVTTQRIIVPAFLNTRPIGIYLLGGALQTANGQPRSKLLKIL
jgi:hypothetical protein